MRMYVFITGMLWIIPFVDLEIRDGSG